MSWDDYEIEAAFARDFPYGVASSVWPAKSGDIPISEMSDNHIKNCMKMVGPDDNWYAIFKNELEKRKKGEKRYAGH